MKLHDVIKINLRQKQEHLTLSYLPVNKELSTLHLEFNKAARTLKITSESEASSNYKQAQLNYHEAYLIFKDFSNQRQEGVCISNIGTMQMRSQEYGKALQTYDVAIDKQKEALQEMSRAGLGVLDGRINFVLGARFYLKGLAMYYIIKTLYDN